MTDFEVQVENPDGAVFVYVLSEPSVEIVTTVEAFAVNVENQEGSVFERTPPESVVLEIGIPGPMGPRGPQGERGAKGDQGIAARFRYKVFTVVNPLDKDFLPDTGHVMIPESEEVSWNGQVLYPGASEAYQVLNPGTPLNKIRLDAGVNPRVGNKIMLRYRY